MKKNISNWGNYPVIESDEYAFKFKEELSGILKDKDSYIARGNGRCYGDASLGKQTISTLSHNKIIEFNQQTGQLRCEAGLTLDKILEFCIPKGYFLPVTPGTKYITVGGALASDVHGKNHHSEGTFADHVVSFTIFTASGELMVVTKDNNPELFKATAGGMGLTGVIIDVTFTLKPITTTFIEQKTMKARNLEEAMSLFDENQNYTYSMAWIDCLQKGDKLGRSVIMVGEHKEGEGKTADLIPNQKQKLNIPFNFPSFVLNQFTVKLFNLLYYGKELKKVNNTVVGYDSFFYPLDVITNWNRMYGAPGFLQYQFVLPLESSKEGLEIILKEIADKGMGSFLAVLKLFGEENENYLSFPMKGYTLALDFPITKSLFPFLDELDKIVLNMGGRIYLSKDARMKEEIFTKSYPHLGEFVEVMKKYNPGNLRSTQYNRLFNNYV